MRTAKGAPRIALLLLLPAVMSFSGLAEVLPPGSTDPTFNPGTGPDGPVLAVQVQEDGKILIGGAFSNFNGVKRASLARLHPDGSLDLSFVPVISPIGGVAGIWRRFDGKMLVTVTGAFGSVALVRLNPDGTVDPSFSPAPYSGGLLAVQADGKLITTFSIPAVIARLHPDGALDREFSTNSLNFNSDIHFAGNNTGAGAVAIRPGGELLVAVSTYYRSAIGPCCNVVRTLNLLDVDGTLRTSMEIKPETIRGISSIAVLPDGGFVAAGGEVAGFTPNLSLRFRWASSSGILLTGVELQSDGKILAWGSGLARLDTNGVPDGSEFNNRRGVVAAAAIQPNGDVILGRTSPLFLARLVGDRVSGPPLMREQPQDQTQVVGQSAHFSARVWTASPVAYQWQFKGADIISATNSFLLLDSVRASDGGSYRVRIVNQLGSVTSAEALLTAVAVPGIQIISEPADQTVVEGFPASFSVKAASPLELFYQWQRNGVDIGGATNSTLPISNAVVQNAGEYGVAIRNLAGLVESKKVRLTVITGLVKPGNLDPTFFAEEIAPASRAFFGGRGLPSLALQNDGRILATANLQVVRLNPDGSRDRSFDPNAAVNGGLFIPSGSGGFDYTSLDGLALQDDGRILIHGEFAKVNGQTNNQVARLNRDGTVDATFRADPQPLPQPPFTENFMVSTLIPLSKGKIGMAGSFLTLNGSNRRNLARLNTDGTPELGFDALAALQALGLTGTSLGGKGVESLVEERDGSLLVVAYHDLVSVRLARLTSLGTLDAKFGIVTQTGYSLAIALQSDGKILLYGYVLEPGVLINGGTKTKSILTRLNSDGTPDTSFNIGSGATQGTNSASVSAIAFQPDGKIFIGGYFTAVNGVPRSNIARLLGNGAVDLDFDTSIGPDGQVSSIVFQEDGSIVIGGAFTHIQGFPRNQIARLYGDFRGLAPVIYVQPQGAEVIVGQSVQLLVEAGGSPKPACQWQLNGTNLPGATNLILFLGQAKLEQAGAYRVVLTNTMGSITSSVAQLVVTLPPAPVIVSQPHALSVPVEGQTQLAITVNSQVPARFLWQHDGAELPGVTGASFALTDASLPDAGTYLAIVTNPGGSVTSAPITVSVIVPIPAPLTIDHDFRPMAIYDPTSTDPTAGFHALAVQADGKVLAGGSFDLRSGLARFDRDGTLDDSFHPNLGTNPIVYSIAIQADDRIVVAGRFNQLNGVPRAGLARLNPNGSLDPTFAPPSLDPALFGSLQIQPDGKILAGSPPAGNARWMVKRFQADGSMDTGFNPPPPFQDAALNSTIRSICRLLPDGKILVARLWDRIARLQSDGALDETFTPIVFTLRTLPGGLAVQSDGGILVYGQPFIPTQPITNGLKRWTANGLPDSSFKFGRTFSANISAVQVGTNDKIFIAGEYPTGIAGQQTNLARLHPDGSFETGISDGAMVGVRTMVQDGDSLLIAGSFATVQGFPRAGLARVFLSSSKLELTLRGFRNGAFQFSFPAETNKVYRPEVADLLNGAWRQLAPIIGDGTYKTVTDSNMVRTQQFYRVRVE